MFKAAIASLLPCFVVFYLLCYELKNCLNVTRAKMPLELNIIYSIDTPFSEHSFIIKLNIKTENSQIGK